MPGAGAQYGTDAYTNSMRLMAMGDILKGGNGGAYYQYMQQLDAAKQADAARAAAASEAAAAEEERRMMMMQAQQGLTDIIRSGTPNPVAPFNSKRGDDVAAAAMAFVNPGMFPGLSPQMIGEAARSGDYGAQSLINMLYRAPDDMGERIRADYEDGQATFQYNDQEARDWTRENAPQFSYGFGGDNPTARFQAEKSMPTPMAPERVAQIMMNPMVPDAYKKELMARFQQVAPEMTAGMQELAWRAEQAGLKPGTQEYRDFILRNGNVAGGDPTADIQEYEYYIAQERAEGRRPMTYEQWQQVGKPEGNTLSVTTSDGSTFSYGPAGVPPGSDKLSTATPRDPGKLSEALSSSDVSYLNAERDKARSAEDLVDLSTRLETLAGEVGYTGPGGKIYGAVDDAIRVLPGDSGARGAFRSASTEAQLLFTERTKGAITEREMALFAAAVPSLSQTGEANQMIAQSLRAGAERVKARSDFMEAWAGKYGSLEGANAAWDGYIQANPMLEKDAETGDLRINPEGDWSMALEGVAKIELGPMTIMQMAPADFSQITPEMIATFTMPQLQAYEKRRAELGQ